MPDVSFRLPFARVFEVIAAKLIENGAATLVLLYFLLQGNHHFLSFVQSRLDIETLIEPILQRLFLACSSPASNTTSPQIIFVAAAVLTILTSDLSFAQSLQSIVLI